VVDISDPEQVGERAAARAQAWLDREYETLLQSALAGLPRAWRRDPYWTEVVRGWAIDDAARELQRRCERDPKFIQRFTCDG